MTVEVKSAGFSLKLFHRVSRTFEEQATKMNPDRDTYKFMQGHVITNQPMRIVFRARETADV